MTCATHFFWKRDMSGIYVINGFYMSMRQVYTQADASIHWFDVEFDSKDMSWADFRGQVLGATDPANAVSGSLRRSILDGYQGLGLTAQPNVGLNGVHASASPFEALAERLNWLQASVSSDSFGQALLAGGLSEARIQEWKKDPQVTTLDGKKGSLFDQLEDKSVEECLATMQSLDNVEVKAQAGLKNRAFVFIKPHANNAAVCALVRTKFAESKITILNDGELTGPVIDSKMLIDNHYLSIANKASLNKPSSLNPPPSGLEEFKKTFNISWADVQAQGRMFNALEACRLTGLDGNQMDTLWATAKKNGKLAKLSGGFYAGLIPVLAFPSAVVGPAVPSAEEAKALAEAFGDCLCFSKASYQAITDLSDKELSAKYPTVTVGEAVFTKFPAFSAKFLLNGFYAGMRSKFTVPEAKIHWYVVEFATEALTWQNFRLQILGATDPALAVSGSLRRSILDEYKALGLATEPNVGDNGVHASASPFEALAEQLNWLQCDISNQPFGQACLAGGVPEATIAAWTKDPQVTTLDGKQGSLFDQLEDKSVEACLTAMQGLANVEVKAQSGLLNRAFVFVKPHAVTAAVCAKVAAKFAEAKIAILSEGELCGPEIDAKQYIDNHYLSIASKASLSKPAQLNPPANGIAEFQKVFGVSWKDALALNVLFNATDGQKALGMTGDEVDAAWASSKKNNHLVKLSGGFYAGRILKTDL
jgi:nucleoside diphosphate kinase